MKTQILKNITLLFCKCLIVMFGFFAIASTAFSCATKAPIESTHTVERILEIKTDSVKVTEVNRAISDSLILNIPVVKTSNPQCDSITQNELNRVLGLLNTYKKSGQNETRIYYNPKKNQIVAWQKIPETKNQFTNTNKSNKASLKEIKYIKLPYKYIPFWVKVLAWIGGLTFAYIVWRIVRIFI